MITCQIKYLIHDQQIDFIANLQANHKDRLQHFAPDLEKDQANQFT